MKLKEYLSQKYSGYQTGLTANEARILGIPHPLKGGWKERHAELEITEDMALRMCEVMSNKAGKFEKRGIAILLNEYGDRLKAHKSERRSAPFPLIMSDELPDDLRRELDDAAGRNRLSLKEEIIKRLAFSIDSNEVMEIAQSSLDNLEYLSKNPFVVDSLA